MKITIEAGAKEIADLVLAVQSQRSTDKVLPNPKDILPEVLTRFLHEKSRDTSEGK